MTTIEQIKALTNSEQEFDNFCQIMDDLQPTLTNILVSEYQQYLTNKLNREIPKDEVKGILDNFFQDYRYSNIFG